MKSKFTALAVVIGLILIAGCVETADLKQQDGIIVENVVSSFNLSTEMNLIRVQDAFGRQAEWNESFSTAVIISPEGKNYVFMVFDNGIVIVTGQKSTQEAYANTNEIMNLLKSKGFETEAVQHTEIENIVARTSLKRTFNLNELKTKMNAEYNPLAFEAAVLAAEVNGNEISIMVFENGEAILSGAKSDSEVEQAFADLRERIEKEL